VEAWSGEKQDGEYWQLVQRFRLLHFPEERGLGARQIAWRAKSDGPVQIGEGLRAAAWLKASGEWELAGYISARMTEVFPRDALVRQLAEEVAAHRKGA
jgi:hypothetical protein